MYVDHRLYTWSRVSKTTIDFTKTWSELRFIVTKWILWNSCYMSIVELMNVDEDDDEDDDGDGGDDDE